MRLAAKNGVTELVAGENLAVGAHGGWTVLPGVIDSHVHLWRKADLVRDHARRQGHGLAIGSDREILEGRGYGMEDARAAINLVYELRNSVPTAANGRHSHPHVEKLQHT